MLGNNFLTGKRVYGSGSFAPNRGQVSAQGAQGYLRRTLAQRAKKQAFNGIEGQRIGAMRIGNDGRSDTRSGVAQSAVVRQQAMMGKKTPGTKPIMGGRKPLPVNPNSNGSAGTGAGTKVPSVTINDQGQIELPYNSGYSDNLYNSLADFNNQLMDLQIGSQQQAAQYASGLRDENLGYRQQQLSDLNRNASSGMAFSSQYAKAVGDTAGEHQNAINDLDSANSLYGQQVAAQRAAIQDNFNQQLQAAAQQRQRELNQQAGSLGLGKAGVTKNKGHKGKTGSIIYHGNGGSAKRHNHPTPPKRKVKRK